MITQEEFVRATDIDDTVFQDIVSLGWLEVSYNDERQVFLSDGDLPRVRKLVRICTDFELPTIGGAIIVDLLERIEYLEQMLKKRSMMDELS